NEDEVILKTLESIRKNVKIPYKIIVVNDHSIDNTELVVKRYLKKNKKVQLLNNKTKKSGFSQAIKLGTLKAKSDLLVYVMADLCDDPKTINKMYQKIDSGKWDIVCGSRYMKGGKKKSNDNKLQGALSYLVNSTLYHFLRIPTSDTSNAFKMYKKEVLK